MAKPYTNHIALRIQMMPDKEFREYVLRKINKKLFRLETWAAIEARFARMETANGNS